MTVIFVRIDRKMNDLKAEVISHPESIPESVVAFVTLVTFVADVTDGYSQLQIVSGDMKNRIGDALKYIDKMYPRARSKNDAIPHLNDMKNIIKNDNMLNSEQKRKLSDLVTFVTPSIQSVTLAVTRLLQPRFSGETLLEKMTQYVENTYGFFTTQQVYSDLSLSRPEDKAAIRVYLGRMVKNKIIEKGDKNGQYRKVDSDTSEMDFINAPDECSDIFLPLGINHHAKIMPGNIIVVAGTTNAGKTGFLLNVVNDNMNKFDVHYFSSEMGPSEMKSRLKNFDRPINSWRFKAYERSHDFHDVIRPGKQCINIIDYVEIADEYWRISGMIRKIYDKLDGAIAIIALQKNMGAEFGAGGMKSAEKARLYLSMSPHRVRFAKVKAWANPEDNPNGKVLEYKLRAGCHFTVTRDWHHEEGGK